jgi:peroxiredoxin
MLSKRLKLGVGDSAPDFEGDASDGRHLRLRDLRGKPVVVYFYPKAFTPICSEQTRRFRDNYRDIVELGAEVIGVSTDSLETQCRFGESQAVQFPLVADDRRQICLSYGVSWPVISRARRVTFVVGETGIVEAVFHHEFQVSKHLDGVLAHLRSRRAAQP